MAGTYAIIRTIHNAVGGITLLLTLASVATLLFVARTSGGPGTLLRVNAISASLQALLGIILILLALVAYGGGYAATYWFHYLLGILAVGAVSALTARARRAPDGEARRYGLMLVGVFALVLVTFLVGLFRYTLLGA